MKILVLAPHPFFQARGTPIAVRAVLEFLSARGHQVDLLTFSEGQDVQIPNVRIHRIMRVPGLRGIRPGFSFKKLFCDLLMLQKSVRMAMRNRYDLIHAVEEAAFIAAAVRALTGIPYVYDMDSSLAEQLVETYPRLEFAFPTLRKMEAIAVRGSVGVLTVCAALEAVALGHAPGKPVGRVEDASLLSSPGQPQADDSLLPPGVADSGKVAMYVGNLAHYQGIDLLLEGFRHTLKQLPTAHLVIVGGRDDDIIRYTIRARDLGIHTRVHFLGPRPVSLLDRLLREANVLVSPRLKGLNTPMKIYSYLDSGTAVLATRLPTHTQVVDDRTAYLVDPVPEALGRGLTELLSNPELRESLARKAKAYVQEEFTPEAARRKLGSFYTTIETKAVEARA